jgi:hypothetical protein
VTKREFEFDADVPQEGATLDFDVKTKSKSSSKATTKG